MNAANHRAALGVPGSVPSTHVLTHGLSQRPREEVLYYPISWMWKPRQKEVKEVAQRAGE